MRPLLRIMIILLLAASAASATPPPPASPDLAGSESWLQPFLPKTDTPGNELLLPFYLVENGNPNGTTTLFAVRNESSEAIDIKIEYFLIDRPQIPQDLPSANTDVTLAPKQVKTVNVRDVPVLVDEDGFARGFVKIRGLTANRFLQGDYFQVTPGQGFATGDRLLNIDPTSSDNDLCNRVTSRYLNGGPFGGGSTFYIWLRSDTPPSPEDAILSYSVYNEAGEPFVEGIPLPIDTVALTRTAANLLKIGPLIGPPFGVIEFDFGPTEGYVTVVMSASGLYSVGVEAVCLDNSPL